MSLFISAGTFRKKRTFISEPPGGGGGSLTFVGYATGTHTGDTSTWNLSLTGLTGGVASSPAEDDIVIVCHAIGGALNQDPGASGYTELADLYSDDSNDINLSVSYKIMTATPDTSVTLNAASYANPGQSAVAFVWRGVDTTTPIDVTTTTATSMNSLLEDPPSITPVTTGAVVIGVGAGSHTYSTGTETLSSSDLSNFVTQDCNGSGRDAVIGVGSYAWTSGAVDPAAFTFNSADNASYAWAAITLALRPA